MKLPQAKKLVQQLLAEAKIELNGKNPADIQVHNEKFYARVLKNPILALGESYVEGWWDCECLDQFFYALLRADLAKKIKENRHLFYPIIKEKLRSMLMSGFNLQKK